MRALLLASVSIFLLLITACSGGDKNDLNLRLTHAERERIDSIYTNRLDSLRPIWDSLCDASYSNNLELAVDSIITERKEEEVRLRSRLPN